MSLAQPCAVFGHPGYVQPPAPDAESHLLPRDGQSPRRAAELLGTVSRPGGIPLEALRRSRIAILDDDEDNVVLLGRLLRRAGFEHVEGATDPAAALAGLVDAPPDLLLLDLHMEPVDGFAVLARLAHLLRGRAPLPVIVLTADGTGEAKRRALALGARDFLTKPYDLVEVLLRVGNLLESAHLLQRVRAHNTLLERDEERRLADLDQIAADLAHELRTPLYAIRGITENLLFEDQVAPAVRQDLTSIDGVAEEALEIVNRQIWSAREAAGRAPLALGPVRVPELLDGIARTLRTLARAQEISLVLDIEPELPLLHADGLVLGQILRHLVSNAIRHTFAGEVRVHVRADGPRGEVCFEVHDTGVGIHPDDLERIFERFGRVDGGAPREAGGLGLPQARRLAEGLGGSVTVVSELGHGSTFMAAVPCGQAPDGVPRVL